MPVSDGNGATREVWKYRGHGPPGSLKQQSLDLTALVRTRFFLGVAPGPLGTGGPATVVAGATAPLTGGMAVMTIEGSGRSRKGMPDVMSVSCKEKRRKFRTGR